METYILSNDGGSLTLKKLETDVRETVEAVLLGDASFARLRDGFRLVLRTEGAVQKEAA